MTAGRGGGQQVTGYLPTEPPQETLIGHRRKRKTQRRAHTAPQPEDHGSQSTSGKQALWARARRQKSQHPQESITQTQRGESIREAPIKGHANKTAGLPPSPSHQQCEKAHLEQLLRELAAKRTGGPWAGPWGTARTPEETGGSAG